MWSRQFNAGTDDGLERLLGRTRVAALLEVAGRTARATSEVAEAVGIALPSVSYQIGLLREGGIVAGHRAGKYVPHRATRLGLRLPATGSDHSMRRGTEWPRQCGDHIR